MTCRIRYALALLLVSFALTAACADTSGPSRETACDYQNPNTCR